MPHPARPGIRAASLIIAICLSACAGAGDPHAAGASAQQPARRPPAGEARLVSPLRDALVGLGPEVSQDEAAGLAARAFTESEKLATAYGVIGPPLFQNFLVNIGVKKRGLCYQWTEDLMRRLATSPLRSLKLHWGTARGGTWREHNCIVVTARGQPFADGIVLDAWRHSGRLFWAPVRADHYPWVEDDSGYMAKVTARRSDSQH